MTYERTRKALEHYDRRKAEIAKKFDTARFDGAIYAAVSELDQEINIVRMAFFEDTRNRNSLSGCLAAAISDIRKIATS